MARALVLINKPITELCGSEPSEVLPRSFDPWGGSLSFSDAAITPLLGISHNHIQTMQSQPMQAERESSIQVPSNPKCKCTGYEK